MCSSQVRGLFLPKKFETIIKNLMFATIFEYLNEHGLTNTLFILFVCCTVSGIFILVAIYGKYLGSENSEKVLKSIIEI